MSGACFCSPEGTGGTGNFGAGFLGTGAGRGGTFSGSGVFGILKLSGFFKGFSGFIAGGFCGKPS
jgi:hypothetical protein